MVHSLRAGNPSEGLPSTLLDFIVTLRGRGVVSLFLQMRKRRHRECCNWAAVTPLVCGKAGASTTSTWLSSWCPSPHALLTRDGWPCGDCHPGQEEGECPRPTENAQSRCRPASVSSKVTAGGWPGGGCRVRIWSHWCFRAKEAEETALEAGPLPAVCSPVRCWAPEAPAGVCAT